MRKEERTPTWISPDYTADQLQLHLANTTGVAYRQAGTLIDLKTAWCGAAALLCSRAARSSDRSLATAWLLWKLRVTRERSRAATRTKQPQTRILIDLIPPTVRVLRLTGASHHACGSHYEITRIVLLRRPRWTTEGSQSKPGPFPA